MLRIQMTAADLGRIRVGGSWGPLAETLFSLRALERRRPLGVIDGWRDRVCRELDFSGRSPLARVLPLAHLDLATVVGSVASMGEAVEGVLRADVVELQHELEAAERFVVSGPAWVKGWMRRLYTGDLQARRWVAAALRDYSVVAVDPFWSRIVSRQEADRAFRARVMADRGVDGLLSTLHPAIRWNPPVLELVVSSGVDRDTFLRGRPLVLVPSVFCLEPMLFCSTVDEALPELLFYPVLRDIEDALAFWAVDRTPGRALEALLGRSRALVLAVIADTCTTSELARRTGISLATASYHAGVLREAGLVGTRRYGSSVLHTITSRGAVLLGGEALRS